VLQALDEQVKQFRGREELWPLRVPREPLLLEAIVSKAAPEDAATFDVASLQGRTLLDLEWDDGSAWTAWMTVLPSGFKIYCDTGGGESRVLASGGRNEGEATDRAFLQLLAESAGEHFGIEASGVAPRRVRSSIGERSFLVDIFVDLFEVMGAEDTVREQLSGEEKAEPSSLGRDFRLDVEQWLDLALAAPGHR
jgi:hypothetical protein